MTRLQIVADENIPLVSEFFATLGDVSTYPGRTLTAEQVKNADVLLVRSVTPVNETLLAGSRVQFVGTCTIGIDHLDVEYLEQKGIAYHSAPGCNANSVVEYIFSVLAKVKTDWLQASFGIIGCGNVGGHLYRRLKALNLPVVCYDPFLTTEDNPDLCGLDEVLNAEVICMHTPLTHGGEFPSHHLLDEARIQQLKPGCLLINAGRGPVVDNQALKRVLQQRDDLTVVLDVWEPEPNLDIELMQQVALASPHIAGYSYDGKVEGTAMIYRALCRQLNCEETVLSSQLLQDDNADFKKILPNEMPNSGDILQSTVNQIILQAYDVGEDDRRMRSKLLGDECQQSSQAFAQGFDELRKHYPKRREFPCFQVDLSSENFPADKKKSLNKLLATLGFDLTI
ncbi:4-phosphoerythronate dehydrogenase [Aestuariicella sp. G3-2]|uniref:4-phosphoerythronate dehydrogenase n=1 Tax=Pseudomaricurvus albidus TaxID=2842452 RepID=UPI001C0B2C83|nr:4-phosphoerythronate dehydrogenase [Aestuariicella albida]MBU3070808.1 4-phosphoerythronate dehydrogenase [Aestuariicella albida]